MTDDSYIFTINRDKYKQIKKLDHSQMQNYLTCVYKTGYANGYESGCKSADTNSNLDINKIVSAISSVKGIGPKKLEEIVSCLKVELSLDDGDKGHRFTIVENGKEVKR